MSEKVIEQLNECIKENQSVALVTIVFDEGSAPRGIGSMMIVDENGVRLSGTIGGGKVEEQAKKDSMIAIKNKTSQTISYDLVEDGALGMICGGKVDVFIKVFSKNDQLIIVGGGHICEQLVYFAKPFPYDVTVIDHREAYANNNRYPDITAINGDVIALLNDVKFDENTSVVIITHGHLFDLEALEIVIEKGCRYVGMIGSSSKIKTCYDTLVNKGVKRQLLEAVYAPIGVNTGGETPEDIALGILAEIQTVKFNAKLDHMKNIKGVL